VSFLVDSRGPNVDHKCGPFLDNPNENARLPDARPRPHNPKVAGSNPAPATLKPQALSVLTERVFESSGSSFETLTVL